MRHTRNVDSHIQEMRATIDKIMAIVATLSTTELDPKSASASKPLWLELNREVTDGLAIIRDINSLSSEQSDAGMVGKLVS